MRANRFTAGSSAAVKPSPRAIFCSVMHGPIPPVSIDGVKRRCNAGMGRCQGGFCGPRVHEILSRETGRPMEQIEQDRTGSYLLTGETKVGGAKG